MFRNVLFGLDARALPSWIRTLLVSLGADLRMNTRPRAVLEKTILPFFVEGSEYRAILFVGCEWYTSGYRRMFAEKNYWTLEIDPGKKRYGSRQHVVDSVENVDRHFAPRTFDAILCNGVYGWGLNEREAAERAFSGCYECLRDAGVFVLGWNDVPKRTPFPLSECAALNRFRRFAFPPLGGADYRVPGPKGHVYSFYLR
jgi:SAM-dependent methyltransferase